ncbi:MAG: HPr family phosphocarrier protein, partial [Treponemataceae bacterium]|nr:HPr family phosphocarrier protein [Treponemataceae bacterium]
VSVNAKSIMGVITMAAGYNTSLVLKADGEGEQEAADAIYQLFENRFEED